MNAISKKTKRFALIVLGLALVIAVFAFTGKKVPTKTAPVGASSLSTSSGVPVIPGGGGVNDGSIDEFSSLLSTVQSISIDTTLFQDPSYLSLRDHPIILGTDLIGRTNPFLAIGTDQATVLSPGVASIQTLQPGKITKTTAELGALVTLPDTSPVSVIFEYGTSSDVFDFGTSPLTATKSGTTLSSITGLTPGTLYYVRASVVKGSISTEGNTMSFTTSQ